MEYDAAYGINNYLENWLVKNMQTPDICVCGTFEIFREERTPLIHAAHEGHKEVENSLLSKGAKMDAKNAVGLMLKIMLFV